MITIKDLSKLLRFMDPWHVEGEYVYCTVSSNNLLRPKEPLLIYQEDEGTTFILKKDEADELSLNYTGTWGLITLKVNSDLATVGFLAVITDELAKAGIPVNAVSAYHHDHLLVPSDKVDDALDVLRKLSIQKRPATLPK